MYMYMYMYYKIIILQLLRVLKCPVTNETSRVYIIIVGRRAFMTPFTNHGQWSMFTKQEKDWWRPGIRQN